MAKCEKGPELFIFEVCHPDYGTARVPSIGPDSATLEAAKKWGVPELWGRIAAYCDVRKMGPARKPRCRKCQEEFGKPGDPDGLCLFCMKAETLYRKQMGTARTTDRRARWERA